MKGDEQTWGEFNGEFKKEEPKPITERVGFINGRLERNNNYY